MARHRNGAQPGMNPDLHQFFQRIAIGENAPLRDAERGPL
jgi:hypothetical protein